jgi:hypothetical protein
MSSSATRPVVHTLNRTTQSVTSSSRGNVGRPISLQQINKSSLDEHKKLMLP